MKVLVTGATGFVGGHMCRRLLAAGHEVIAATRRDGALGLADGARAVNLGDLAAPVGLADCLAGVDAVVHLAARTHVMNERASDAEAAYRRINVEATAELLARAQDVGVSTFLYLSSVKAAGEVSTDGPLTIADRPAPQEAYGHTKLEAEGLVNAAADRFPGGAVIVRPPLIYGPGLKGNLLTLFKAVDRGVPLPLASVANRRSVVFVGNLVDAMVALLAAPAPGARTYFATDGEDVSTPELIRRIAAALDRPARLLPFPVALLRAAGHVTGRSEMIARLTGSLQVDGEPLRRDLGGPAPHPMKEGLEQTAAWYKSRRST